MLKTKCVSTSNTEHALDLYFLIVSLTGHRYCVDQLSSLSIYDTRNMLLLRRDLHFLFDQRRFAFAVKRSRSNETHLITHVLNYERADELMTLYHNRISQVLRGISIEFIFARFAWTLFTSPNFPSFTGMGRLAVQLYDPESGRIHQEILLQQDIRSKLKLFDAYSRSQSRSTSPRKRSRDECAVEDDEPWNLDSDSDRWLDLVYPHSPARGRCRKRSWSVQGQESLPDLVGSSASPRRTSSSPRSMHWSGNKFVGQEFALMETKGSQKIGASIADDESPAKRERLDHKLQATS